MTHPARSLTWTVAREDLRVRGGSRQPGKLIVADFGLRHQDTAAKMLDQVAADRAEPPSRQRAGRTMTDDHEVGSDLFGDPRDLLSGGPHAQPRRRREADGLEPPDAFVKDGLIGRDLVVDRDHDATFQGGAEGRFDDSQQEYLSAAILRELRAFPQRQSPLDRAVISKKNFLVQGSPPSFAALASNRSLARIARPISRIVLFGGKMPRSCGLVYPLPPIPRRAVAHARPIG